MKASQEILDISGKCFLMITSKQSKQIAINYKDYQNIVIMKKDVCWKYPISHENTLVHKVVHFNAKF